MALYLLGQCFVGFHPLNFWHAPAHAHLLSFLPPSETSVQSNISEGNICYHCGSGNSLASLWWKEFLNFPQHWKTAFLPKWLQADCCKAKFWALSIFTMCPVMFHELTSSLPWDILVMSPVFHIHKTWTIYCSTYYILLLHIGILSVQVWVQTLCF